MYQSLQKWWPCNYVLITDTTSTTDTTTDTTADTDVTTVDIPVTPIDVPVTTEVVTVLIVIIQLELESNISSSCVHVVYTG